MPYTIVFRTRNTQDVSAAEAKTRSSGDRDRRRPPKEERGDQVHNLAKEGEIGVEMLRVLAKERGRIASERLKHSSHNLV
jgi:hypothetical protein